MTALAQEQEFESQDLGRNWAQGCGVVLRKGTAGRPWRFFCPVCLVYPLSSRSNERARFKNKMDGTWDNKGKLYLIRAYLHLQAHTCVCTRTHTERPHTLLGLHNSITPCSVSVTTWVHSPSHGVPAAPVTQGVWCWQYHQAACAVCACDTACF